MTTNPNWPLTVTQVDFANGLNTSNTPSWTDLSDRCWSLQCDRGRQYELDQTQAGVGGAVLADKDEALNPTNGSSAYSPNVLPYRPFLDQAMWPPVPVGGAVNICGTGAGYDPSFETTATGSTPPKLLVFNCSPTVQAANPQFGSKSLQWSVTGGSPGPEQVAGFTVPCIPGQQYTASVYYRQTAANTGVLFVNGGASSTTTTTTGAYVRLTVTFTATQPTHQLFAGSLAPTLAGTVNIDGFQVEPGASANTFSATGPVIYGVHRGYVERWPSKWNHQGMYGYAEITTVDAFAALAAKHLHVEYVQKILSLAPAYFWPLWDGENATSFAEVSGNGGPPLTRMDGKYGPAATFQSGTSTSIPGDPGGTGLSIDAGATGPSFVNIPVTVVQAGVSPNSRLTNVGAAAPPFAVTVAVWAAHSALLASTSYFVTLCASTFFTRLAMATVTSDAIMALYVNNPPSGGDAEAVATDVWADSKMHLYVMTLDITTGPLVGTTKLYVDGAHKATDTQSADTGPWRAPWQFNSIQLGSLISPDVGFTESGLPDGVFAHLAVFNRELTSQEIADLYTAGQGYVGETSGARIARYLSGNYAGPTSIDTGQSVMGVSDLAGDTALLDACQNVTVSENGNFWVDGAGVLQFAARTRRYLATASTATIGEDQAGGEYPYEDDIAYDDDPTLVYNDVKVTQSGGIVVTASDTASQDQYGPRSYQRTINVLVSSEAIDAANWILYTHKDPQQRIATLVLKPSANPALWPMALGAEIGQRVTVKRRTTAGYTMSADYFIEQISHDRKPDSWTVSIQMSPAAKSQVWLLGDATYGVLDSTTVLGY